MVSSSGEKYEGYWFKGKQHGYGVLSQVDGTKLEGVWKNGIFLNKK